VVAFMGERKIGYIRVSSFEQNESRQLADIVDSLDKVFIDKASGKDTHRPSLEKMLEYAREGDTIIVHSMDRLARNLDDLRKLVNSLTSRNIKIQFVKESLTFTGDDNPMSILLLSVMGAFSEFERSLIKERQREGIEIAKKNKVYKGRKKTLSTSQVKEIFKKIESGEKKATIARDLKISRETLYQYIRSNIQCVNQ
jgi:DNA invertase Pin-like site-specific DNA recombinase